MQATEKARFDAVYLKHLRALKLKGHADKTIEAYSRAIRRLAEYLDRCPDDLTKDELDGYVAALLETIELVFAANFVTWTLAAFFGTRFAVFLRRETNCSADRQRCGCCAAQRSG